MYCKEKCVRHISRHQERFNSVPLGWTPQKLGIDWSEEDETAHLQGIKLVSLERPAFRETTPSPTNSAHQAKVSKTSG